MSIKRGWHLLVNTGMMAGKMVTYYIRVRIWNEQEQTTPQQANSNLPAAWDRVCGYHSPERLLFCSFRLPSTAPRFSSFFPSSRFQNKVRSNERVEDNTDSLILLREMSGAPSGLSWENQQRGAGPPGPAQPRSPGFLSLWLLRGPLALATGQESFPLLKPLTFIFR